MRARLIAEVAKLIAEWNPPPFLAAPVPHEPDEQTKRVAAITGVPIEHFEPLPILVVAEADCCGNCKRHLEDGTCTLPRVGTKQLRKTAATTWCIEHERKS